MLCLMSLGLECASSGQSTCWRQRRFVYVLIYKWPLLRRHLYKVYFARMDGYPMCRIKLSLSGLLNFTVKNGLFKLLYFQTIKQSSDFWLYVPHFQWFARILWWASDCTRVGRWWGVSSWRPSTRPTASTHSTRRLSAGAAAVASRSVTYLT